MRLPTPFSRLGYRRHDAGSGRDQRAIGAGRAVEAVGGRVGQRLVVRRRHATTWESPCGEPGGSLTRHTVLPEARKCNGTGLSYCSTAGFGLSVQQAKEVVSQFEIFGN